MRKNYIANLLLVLISVLLFACKRKAAQHHAETSMTLDSALLNVSKPVNEQVHACDPGKKGIQVVCAGSAGSQRI